MLSTIEEYLNLVMLPALKTGQKWGPLPYDKVAEFLAMFQSFNLFLSSNTLLHVDQSMYLYLFL